MIGLLMLSALVIYVWLARLAIKHTKNRILKYVVIVTFILIPTWDIIPGRLYFNHLCSTKAGAKIYRTVQLPAGYWDERGAARFSVNQYDHNKMRYIFTDKRIVPAPGFEYTRVTSSFSEIFHIDEDVLRVIESEKGISLGEYFLFRYWGGWLAKNFSPHNTAVSCEANDLDSWPLNIFKPAISTR
jgi:hypothetical protein